MANVLPDILCSFKLNHKKNPKVPIHMHEAVL